MAKLTSTDDLKSGMILDKDIIDQRTGLVLITKNTIITENFINRLSKYGIHEVYVQEEIEQEEVVYENLRNDSFTKEYSRVEIKLEDIFQQVREGGKIKPDGIVDNIEELVNEVVIERDILTQLRLLRKKDDYTFNHCLGVSILSITLGKWLGYSSDKLVELAIAGLFHDIGKLKIPDEIVKKPGRLTKDECDEMKRHSYYGYEILKDINKFNDDILQGVLQHHEKNDGLGYPNGLAGDEIHEYAKIISVCDIYHALTSDRVYKVKDSPLRVADHLRMASFNYLDPYITQVFLKNISRFYVGNKVSISDGSIGIIVYIHPQDKTKPIVKIGDKFVDFLKERDVEILDIII